MKRRSEGWGVGVRGVFWYIILIPDKFCLSPGPWDSLSHIISVAASTRKLTCNLSNQIIPKRFDYCHLTWRPSKDTDHTHFATPAGERRAAE